ncbi:MAG TPA: AraC family transcriptional regulator [Candidatus Fournierella merdavium]|uniref:AraC family transcriptional regulator n=1 Tax=Candidatus Allofournierella merdavium TaxID=2838593 RepID=UPI001F89F307|nr:AraC family transcriptional regulator [Candidatus Fournierella merdavium]
MSSNRYDVTTGSSGHLSALLENAKLLYVTDAQFSEDWHSVMHSHPNLELFYCVRGIGELRMKDRVLPVGSDDMIIVNPNVEHTESSIPSNPLEYIALGISGVDLIFDPQGQHCSVLNYRESRSEIVALLRMLISEASRQPNGWDNVCQHLLVVLLSLLLRHTHFTLNIEQGLHTNKECAAARRYIDEHFAEPIDLDILANITHVNKYYLAHAFKREYGISPINYLIERRIRESKYLLEHTDYALSQIAHFLGISSSSYFSQSFRRSTGQSPTEYRKQVREAASQGSARA